MRISCPPVEELLWLLDGELTEHRATALRLHLRSCSRCEAEWRRSQRLLSRIATPLADSRPANVAEVMRRLGSQPPLSSRSARPRWRVAAAALSVLAASLLALVLFPAREQKGFQARGEAALETWDYRVGMDFYVMGASPRRLESGTPVPRDTPLLGIYRNSDPTGPVYLLAFVVDMRGTVHWLYPGYTEPGQDPAAVLLAPRRGDTPLPETVVLDAPAPGPARLVTVLTREPLHVSDIESLPVSQLSPPSLRAHLGAAVHVREWPVVFTP